MQGKLVWALVWEDSTCLRQLKPGRHNHWVCVLESMSLQLLNWQLVSLCAATSVAHAPRGSAPHREATGGGEPVHRRGEQPRLPETRESRAQQQRPSANRNKYAQSFSRVKLFTTPWTVARQASLSMGFSRQEYWSGLPCPPPEDLPNPGMELKSLSSPASSGGFFTPAPPRINKNK